MTKGWQFDELSHPSLKIDITSKQTKRKRTNPFAKGNLLTVVAWIVQYYYYSTGNHKFLSRDTKSCMVKQKLIGGCERTKGIIRSNKPSYYSGIGSFDQMDKTGLFVITNNTFNSLLGLMLDVLLEMFIVWTSPTFHSIQSYPLFPFLWIGHKVSSQRISQCIPQGLQCLCCPSPVLQTQFLLLRFFLSPLKLLEDSAKWSLPPPKENQQRRRGEEKKRWREEKKRSEGSYKSSLAMSDFKFKRKGLISHSWQFGSVLQHVKV